MNFAHRAFAIISDALFPGPLRAAFGIGLVFVAVTTATRLGLAVFAGEFAAPGALLAALGIGLVFDLGVAAFVIAPICLLIAVWPRRRMKGLSVALGVLMAPLSVLFAFTAFAEFTFWNEFSSRFNFIAVDYLVYSREVVGNIRESYNLPVLLCALALASAAVWLAAMQAARRSLFQCEQRYHLRAAATWITLPLVAYFALDARYKEVSGNAVVNELAGNGYYDILHAFWLNEIDYQRFYRTIDPEKARAIVAGQLQAAADAQPSFRRDVKGGDERRINVVMVTIESFSASFMEAFGGRNNLTPNMDRLAREGLLFTRMYATGTRTVRGLEAVTLSMPPGPGHSIVKRADNAGLFNIGAVFRDHGYDSLYVYGGYAYFDNMQAFYQGSGYTVVDRLAVAKKDVHHENIWGIADEDLFTLTLRELDHRHAQGHKVFAHVMTTSNHRPYTYPNGRIDLPSKSSGRDGGVKYTDWAIGDFIERARAKPWFNDTMFVFVADHTHNGRGKTELPPENYHIPMIVYAPAHIPAGRVDAIASQIDTAPTILGLLNFNYESLFFGHDILKPGPEGERAFLSNYQTVGMYKNGRIVELRPKKRVRVVDAMTHHEVEGPEAAALIEEAIAYYQTSSWAFHSGELRAIAQKPKVRLPPS